MAGARGSQSIVKVLLQSTVSCVSSPGYHRHTDSGGYERHPVQ